MDFQNNFKQYLNSKNQSENDDLTPKEMQELQEAINNSRDTARTEEEKREYERQAAEIQKHFYKSNTSSGDIPDDSVKEKAFTPKRWVKPPKSPVDVFKVEKDILSTKKEFEITFQDLLEASGKSLDVVYHNPVFDLPLTINPEYQKYSMKQRAKLLYHYFAKMDVLRSGFAKESFSRAPHPKPILPSNKCKNSLLKNGFDEASGSFDDFVDQLPVQDLYVSRAGRQVKRKIYTEDTEGDSDPDFKYSKKNKSDDSDTKITLDTPFISEENHNEEKTTPKAAKTRKETPKRPAPLSIKKYTSRSEVLFDKVVEDAEKKKQQQKEMDFFEKSLSKWDDNEEHQLLLADSPVKENHDNDADFVRKRVVPPIPTKKGGRRRASKQEAVDKNDTKTESPPGSPVLKRYTNLTKSADSKPKPRARVQKKDSAGPEEASVSKLEKAVCPICEREFLQSEIVNHASNCGIEDEPAEAPVRTNSTVKTISCSLCDREFAMNTDYEVHVKQCIAGKVTDL